MEASERLIALLETLEVPYALDDVHATGTHFSHELFSKAKLIKLDREIMHNSRNSKKAKSFLKEVVEMCRSLESKIILEGIECAEDIAIALECGVDCIQRHFFEALYLNSY